MNQNENALYKYIRYAGIDQWYKILTPLNNENLIHFLVRINYYCPIYCNFEYNK